MIIEQPPSRRLELALYCLPRALESLWRLGVEKKVVRPVPNGELWMFSLTMGVMMTLYQNDVDSISPTFQGVLVRMFGAN